jgi:tetratricopeptide (TPR) repeat protein
LSVTGVRGDTAADLFNTGVSALNNEQYADAAKAFQTIITSYPTFQDVDTVHLLAGRAYFYAKDYSSALTALQKEAAPEAKPQFHAEGLFLTGLSQFYAAQDKTTAANVDTSGYQSTVATFTDLVNFIQKNPTPDNKNFLEQALYFRSLADYEVNKYDDAISDLTTLTTDPQFAQSLSRSDYFLQLGDIYSIQTSDAVGDKKALPETVTALAAKATTALDAVISDPNAIVQANDASLAKAQVQVMLAELDNNSSDGYQKALDTYRQVKRKADLVAAQTQRLKDLRALAAKIAQQNALNHTGGGAGNQLEFVINRLQGKLDQLQSPDSPDPIIDALIGIADCYINITGPGGKKESDEARTILHRLVAHAKLTPDQQKKVDFDVLFSYVLGGQTDKATKALSDYLTKHAGDPNADSLSLQIGEELFKRKNYDGALSAAQKSISDFPQGRYVADAYTLEARALSALHRTDDSKKIIDNFLQSNPNSPQAYAMLITRAANEEADSDLAAAMADFGKVKDAAAAGAEIQAGAYASYIQVLQKLGKNDEVVAEAKKYEAKYPQGKNLNIVMLFAAQAMMAKGDPGAVVALQDVALKFPQDPIVTPIALYSVVLAYQKAGNMTLMLQAAKDLQATCPEAYSQILLADDAVSDVLQKQRPPAFDDAAALYEPLTKASDPGVAASAQNKLADVRFAQAKGIHYQSLQPEQRPMAQKILGQAESAYLATLQNWPTQIDAVGDAFDGLINVAQRNRSWGIFKDDSDLENYLSDLGKQFSAPDMLAHFEMAKAGLVFVLKNGAAQYPAALDRFRKVAAANPGLRLTRQETDHFGELLLAAKDYDGAQKVYQDLLDNTQATDAPSLASAYYGLGAVAFSQDKFPEARDNFTKLKALPNGAAWFKHINDVNYDLAYIEEQSGTPADLAAAKQAYAAMMTNMSAGAVIQTKALVGYGRILEKAGFTLKPAPQGPNEYAVHYYQQPNLMFFTATPEQSAEGLYRAGEAYERDLPVAQADLAKATADLNKAATDDEKKRAQAEITNAQARLSTDKANANKQYDTLTATYKDTAPDWVAKAQAAETQ